MIDPLLAEWLNIMGRWIHVIAGIMWVGNSMLFNWLDHSLIPPDEPDSRSLGKTWLFHGGGFYHVEKYTSDTLPPVLHWFKWQSYTTWITGFTLLMAVYYSDGGAFLLPSGSSWEPAEAARLGLAFVFGGFLVYDLFWRTPLAKRYGVLAGLLSLTVLFVAIYGLHQVFNGRAAYLHTGAMLGTFMAGNVFFHIIPSQRALVRQINAGGGYNKDLAVRAKTRSIHNNYFTFPLIFTMVSNHFAGLFGHSLNWLVLLVILLTGAVVRHFLNIRWTFTHWQAGIGGTLGTAAVLVAAILYPVKPAAGVTGAGGAGELVPFGEVRALVNRRCLTCHSAWPTQPGMLATTKGVLYDHPEDIRRHAAKILQQAVETHTMPLGNLTGMTDEERAMLGRWIRQGAKLE